jgi:delta24(24(1))-sterol reductase
MSTQPRSRKANSSPTQSDRQTDASSPPLKHHHSDDTIVKEFGGPIGVTMMMIFFPLLMNYLWLCVQINSGSLLSLLSVKDIKIFFGLIAEHATPTWFAAKLYLGFCLLQGFLAYVMPRPIVKGLPIPSENNKQLEYRCNGV